MANNNKDTTIEASNFVQNIIETDLEQGKNEGRVHTRFPPEPNGFAHIGHAKSICLNFGLAQKFGGTCNLRFDDTNPLGEEAKYVEAIKKDIKWLGFDWHDNEFFASDYYPQLYEFAVQLIKEGKAYVCDLGPEEVKEHRGTLTEPGKDSPFRNRSVEENLDLFERMKKGEFEEGRRVLRAKIDMASPNMNMRDPVIYRIMKAHHFRTGNDWNVYPMYDFAHGLSDMLEGITHSVCTLEFEDHRPLYDWYLNELKTPCHPQQIEFARLSLDYTVMSKRVLKSLVEDGLVSGWDDPRMPTISGLRRRGLSPRSIRNFCERIGVTKKNSIISYSTLEHAVREDLDENAPRAMAVLRPIKVIIENYPEGETEVLEGPIHPKKPELGRRKIPLSREIYIDSDDFMEIPPNKKFHRLKAGGQVRLRYAYVIQCEQVIKDGNGNVTELRCTYDPATKGGVTPEGQKKVKGIIHWVSAQHGIPAEVRIYDRLFTIPNPLGEKGRDFKEFLNPNSLEVLKHAIVEPSLRDTCPGDKYQFERLGYFCTDSEDTTHDHLVFNRTETLKDNWK